MSHWNPKYQLGDRVYYKGKSYFIRSICASASSDAYTVEYGLTTSLPAPYIYGTDVVCFAPEDECDPPDVWEDAMISRDGEQWKAVRSWRVSVPFSLGLVVGFGATPDEALVALVTAEKKLRKKP